MGERECSANGEERRPLAGYEPPGIERVLTPAGLEREVLYAGILGSSEDTL